MSHRILTGDVEVNPAKWVETIPDLMTAGELARLCHIRISRVSEEAQSPALGATFPCSVSKPAPKRQKGFFKTIKYGGEDNLTFRQIKG